MYNLFLFEGKYDMKPKRRVFLWEEPQLRLSFRQTFQPYIWVISSLLKFSQVWMFLRAGTSGKLLILAPKKSWGFGGFLTHDQELWQHSKDLAAESFKTVITSSYICD